MARRPMSLRLEDDVHRALADEAERAGVTLTSLVERFVREGLAMHAHPGIVFRQASSGRRAALAGGPDVWTIVSGMHSHAGSEAERIAALAEEFGIHERLVVRALDYAAAYPREIEAAMLANDRALDEAEARARRRADLMA